MGLREVAQNLQNFSDNCGTNQTEAEAAPAAPPTSASAPEKEQANEAEASPAAPPTSAPAPEKEQATETAELLARLADMGFANQELNRDLLARHNNDLNQVLADLLGRD